MAGKPLKIGISARIYHPNPDGKGVQRRMLQYLEQSVTHWVMSRDVLVVMVPSVNNGGLIHRSNIRLSDYARHLDGLVLQGGADVAPETYGEEAAQSQWKGDRMRDIYEMELVHEFMEARKPVLGICRGAQLINVAFGGTLCQDLKTQHPDAIEHHNERSYEKTFHDIAIEPESGLSRLYPELRNARVNSIHHQAVKKLGRDLTVEAWSTPDRVVEALRWRGRSYMFGVQWHPEFHRPADDGVLDPTPILDEFLTAVRKAA